MVATGALPTEQRCKDMNDVQWLWFYLNLAKDKEEERDIAKNHMDYLGSYINPKLAKAVSEQEARKRKQEERRKAKEKYLREHPNETISSREEFEQELEGMEDFNEYENISYGENIVNDDFEKELQAALAAGGDNPEDLTELPDSTAAGDANETAEDFFKRVQYFSNMAGQRKVDTNPFLIKKKKQIAERRNHASEFAKEERTNTNYQQKVYQPNVQGSMMNANSLQSDKQGNVDINQLFNKNEDSLNYTPEAGDNAIQTMRELEELGFMGDCGNIPENPDNDFFVDDDF